MTRDQLQFEHRRFYEQACALVHPLIDLRGRSIKKLTPAQQDTLQRGIALFDRVLQLNPKNWAAMWMVGKAYQRLSDFEQALHWFVRAHALNPANPNVAREASLCAMELQRSEIAIQFCEHAIAAGPSDPGLRANLALALLFAGEVNRATAVAQNALAKDPSDQITRRIVTLCNAVKTGKRACPHHMRDLK